MNELFHPLDPSPAKFRVEAGAVYVVSVMVSVTCQVLNKVKKTVEKLVMVAGASAIEVVRPLGTGSTITVVVPVTRASVAGGVLSLSQAVVPFSSVK